MKEYKTITKIAGPLVFLEKTEPIGYGELVNLVLADGTMKRGQVLDTSDEMVVVQIFETTAGIVSGSRVKPSRCRWDERCSAGSCPVEVNQSTAVPR